MVKRLFSLRMGLALLSLVSATVLPTISAFFAPSVFAEEEASPGSSASSDPEDATRPSKCESTPKSKDSKTVHKTPRNCLFLEEPVGGRPGYDLFVITKCHYETDVTGCEYQLWNGEAIVPPARGPIQAILTRIPGQEEAQGFTLLNAYVGLVYKYLSGIIVGVVILFVIVGGIQMTTSAGDTQKFDAGKSRITKAIIGMLIWFLASLLLYTINPTFFAF